MFRKQLFQIDLNGLYARLEHLSKAAEFRGAKDIIRTVYSFLVDYSRASFEVLPKLFLKQRDDLSLKMVEQIEMLEEENTLFKDFVGSHSPYTPDHKVEIQVKQVVLSVKVEIGWNSKKRGKFEKDNDALKNMIKNEQAQARSAKETVDLWKVQMDEQTHMCILQSEEHKEMKEKLVHALQENTNRRKAFEESEERVSTLAKQVDEITVDNSNMHSLNATMLIELNDALHEKEVVARKKQ
ncbi:hypothetical protein BASA81_004569 [Batrachochytrium salamandrivorans]|nr:hypothetical protein BASA81_004569 [Batrachochytrium salamandrivorans]